MLRTVAQILALDAVRAGRPRVVAGAGRLDAPVRWVHAIELADAARLLRGGELVLTTGIALPEAPALLDAYVADLAGVGVSAVAVELGRRYTGGLPASFVQAAQDHGLPLIVFEQEVPFIAITEAVHALIIEDQLTELRASARLHEVFTDLAVAGAGPGEILRQAALLAGRPVILEDLSHHVLACEPSGADPARLLDGFEARSRAASQPARTAYDESSGWLITMVGARGEDWGRVILVCGAPPGGTDTVLVERTATTLALGRLLARQHESLERQAHATLISAILAQAHTHPEEAAIRVRALGVPITGRNLITAVIRFRPVMGTPSALTRIAASSGWVWACARMALISVACACRSRLSCWRASRRPSASVVAVRSTRTVSVPPGGAPQTRMTRPQSSPRAPTMVISQPEDSSYAVRAGWLAARERASKPSSSRAGSAPDGSQART